MRCAIDKDSGTNPPYKASEYRSTQNYQYGFFECRLKTVKKSGTVCSLVLYTGPSAGTIWDEIDIEILCKDTTQMQCNYYADSEGGHEHMVSLGFDSASDFHTYGWEWQTGFITWYVDGKPVYTVTNSGQKFPKTASMYICTFWNGTAVDWQGAFDGVVPVYVYYDWVKYSRTNPYASATVEPTAAATPAPTTASCTCTLGDVNCSGGIDIVDALLTAQSYVGLNPVTFNACAADVNRSGSIDIVDALRMAQCYVGLVSCSF
jgi:beta-glucanase (GH16 family)